MVERQRNRCTELLVLPKVTQLESKGASSNSGLPGIDSLGQRKALRKQTSSIPLLSWPELQDLEDTEERGLKSCTKKIWLSPPLLELQQ